MPIRQLLDQAVFNAEEIQVLRGVFEETLRALNLSDRTDPAATPVAKKIVELASQGVRDPIRLRAAQRSRLSPRADRLKNKPDRPLSNRRPACGGNFSRN